MQSRYQQVSIVSHTHGSKSDMVTVEEPLEIWIAYPDKNNDLVEFSLSITMRTPGDDKALVVGFLYAEGLIASCADISKMEFFGPVAEPLKIQNQLKVHLKSGERVADKNFQRYFYSNSSCGVCGKSSIQALQMLRQPEIIEHNFVISEQLLKQLPDVLRASQQDFAQTGGLHAASLVDQNGIMEVTKEDIGRHNAMDKLIGQMLLDGELETNDKMILVSSRASFELVQKALMADIPFFAAIGAPSTAAIDLAKTFGMTLVGFLRHDDYNIYHGPHRIENCP